MDHGNIVEFDQPYNLMQSKSSVFSKMCKETGDDNYDVLFDLAKKSYEKKKFKIEKDKMKMIDDWRICESRIINV